MASDGPTALSNRNNAHSTVKLEQIHEGAFIIHGVVGGRPLYLPLLVEDEQAVLIDTGCASDFHNLVWPALAALHIDSKRLRTVIVTHCDFDHQGGNSAVVAACSGVQLFCGAADRAQIESPEVLLSQRYDAYRQDHDIFYDENTKRWIRDELGAPQPMDGVFFGGERLQLGSDRQLEIVPLAGHSRGHIGVLDLKYRTLFGGDAIHGSGYLDLEGKAALCPTYLYTDAYRATTRRIEQLALDTYVGCHWPIKRGLEIKAFCAESRAFVERARQMILECLRTKSAGASLRELCQQVGPLLGQWPASIHNELCYAFVGHLNELRSSHVITENRSTRPVTYSL